MTRSNPFPSLLRAFFQEWLVEQRSASVHTIRSYRDTWRLLLRFIAERKGGGVARVALADISADEVRAFLHHTEHGRGSTIGTRNCRLAAIRSFFSFVADRNPEYVAQCAEVLTVPLKREPTSAPCYLEPAEVEAISPNPIGALSRECATMRCSRSCTTAARGSRKRLICAPTRSGSMHPTALASMARGARNGSGRKP
jgi:site-specific recombinase XerD